MTAARAIITADSPTWAEVAGRTMSGYATSVIACDAEAAIERILTPDETPDGRPGVAVLLFAFSRDALEKALSNRVGQCVMTCPTTACYNGLPVGEKTVNVGGRLRYLWRRLADLQAARDGRRFWRIPVMDGEFTCEETFGTTKGVAGGNIILLGHRPESDPRRDRGRRRRDEASPRRDPAVPGRDRPVGVEGRQQVQGPPGQHQHRLRPDPPRPGRRPSCRPRSNAPTRSSSTA